MNTLLLEPTDTLFFRDGRPMSGSLSGHGAAWPLPTVTNAALHAALHRADIQGTHAHRRGRAGHYTDIRDRLFGSLTTAGPFPVSPEGTWFFPRPADAQKEKSTTVTLHPTHRTGASSLPHEWLHPVANTQPPTKDIPEPWLSATAYRSYLDQTDPSNPSDHLLADSAFSDTEHSYGIGITPETGTQDGKRFYSAHTIRLRPGWRLGLLAAAHDKDLQADLIATLFPNSGTRTPIIVGGQQRLCTAVRENPATIPLPLGQSSNFTKLENGKFAVKWILLTPAIYPAIQADPAKGITAHTGGWLPNWICPETGTVLLKSGDTSRRERESREAWRQRVRFAPAIPAKLTAAIVGKPIPVTGHALPNEADPDRAQGGAKSTHLAVPAGAVYYFEATTPEAAQALAQALNWHGSTSGTAIQNRRSTLFGEKGFGLGVCALWHSFTDPTDASDPSNQTPHP